MKNSVVKSCIQLRFYTATGSYFRPLISQIQFDINHVSKLGLGSTWYFVNKTEVNWGPPFNRVVSGMGLISIRLLLISKSTSSPGQLKACNWSSRVFLLHRIHMKNIWQPLAAQDLLWNLILTVLLEMRPMLFTSFLQGVPRIYCGI